MFRNHPSDKYPAEYRAFVETTEKFKSLSVLVFGPNGIVYSNIAKDAEGKSSYEFSIKYEINMKPKSTIVAYDFNQNGEIIYDSVELNVQTSFLNFVRIFKIYFLIFFFLIFHLLS